MVVDPFSAAPVAPPEDDDTEAAYRALVLGTRDYVRKCGFRKVLVGLSGGIDSALVAAIATEALGAENVIGVGMPSPYSSQGSIDDSRRLAANLGIRLRSSASADSFSEYTQALEPLFAGLKPRTSPKRTSQSRIRGTLLMALSNKFGALVLTTGNKSEMAVGYCTLYGDMVGALAVIGDLVKTRVYAVCRWLNREREIIPAAILEKPPSAELRPGQKDTDSLPPYEVLDPILEAYVERYETPEGIAARARFSARSRPTGGAPGGALRVQAPAGRAGAEGHVQVVRHGPQISHCRQGSGISKDFRNRHSFPGRPDRPRLAHLVRTVIYGLGNLPQFKENSLIRLSVRLLSAVALAVPFASVVPGRSPAARPARAGCRTPEAPQSRISCAGQPAAAPPAPFRRLPTFPKPEPGQLHRRLAHQGDGQCLSAGQLGLRRRTASGRCRPFSRLPLTA